MCLRDKPRQQSTQHQYLKKSCSYWSLADKCTAVQCNISFATAQWKLMAFCQWHQWQPQWIPQCDKLTNCKNQPAITHRMEQHQIELTGRLAIPITSPGLVQQMLPTMPRPWLPQTGKMICLECEDSPVKGFWDRICPRLTSSMKAMSPDIFAKLGDKGWFI